MNEWKTKQAYIRHQGRSFAKFINSFYKEEDKKKAEYKPKPYVEDDVKRKWAIEDAEARGYELVHPMRMWMVNPKGMCRKHLLGEHVELHMFVGAINKGVNLYGYREKGYVEVHYIKRRHKELAREMKSRGYTHDSPLPVFKHRFEGFVNIDQSHRELHGRCEQCRIRFHKYVLEKPLRRKVKRAFHV